MKKNVNVTETGLKSLVWQNLPFEKAVMELIDNGIAAAKKGKKASVCVSIDEISDTKVRVVVADWGKGMSENELVNALQLGSNHGKNASQLNEHGMGLKNALSVLSLGVNNWVIATKTATEQEYRTVRSPLALKVDIKNEKTIMEWAQLAKGQQVLLLGAPSTIVAVEANRSFATTITNINGRVDYGATITDIRTCMMDNIGLHYRGYLTPAAVTNQPKAEIYMLHARLDNKSRKSSDYSITPEHIPFQSYIVDQEFSVELVSGRFVKCHLTIGALSRTKASRLVAGAKRSKLFYLGSTKTQGVDIRLGDRVIKVHEFERIWKSVPHPAYNYLVGEVHIIDPKAGDFTTTNNKGDINLKDDNWERLFEAVRDIYVPKQSRARNLSEVACERYIELVKTVSVAKMLPPVTKRFVPFAGSEVSLLLSTANGEVQFFNFQASGNPMVHIANTRQQWDGLVLEGLQPTVAKVYAKNVNSVHKDLVRQLCDKMTAAKDPLTGECRKYNIELHDISELLN